MAAPAAVALLGLPALTLLFAAVWHDVRSRTIPNVVPVGLVALFGIHAAILSPLGALPGHLVGAAAVFVPGFLLWTRGFVGGGDVKLLSALALWAGLPDLAGFLLITAVAGGVLALLMALRTHWLLSLAIAVPGLGGIVSSLTSSGLSVPNRQTEANDAPETERPTIPYGVAIAAGGVWVLYRTFMA